MVSTIIVLGVYSRRPLINEVHDEQGKLVVNLDVQKRINVALISFLLALQVRSMREIESKNSS